jgi:tellurite methyltransferase
VGWQKLWQDPEIARQWRERPPLSEVVALADQLAAEGRTRVLDIGCGVGRHTIYLASRGFEVTATDNAPAAVAACRRNLEQAGLTARVLELDMREFPFPDAYFDGVVSTQVIHHTYRATLERIIASITQKLAPSGFFVWAMPSPRHAEFAKGREVEPGTWVDENHREGPVPHHYCTEAEIRELLADYDIQSLEERQVQGRPEGIRHWYVVARRRL